MPEKSWPLDDDTRNWLLTKKQRQKLDEAYRTYLEKTGVDLQQMREEKREMDRAEMELRAPLRLETMRRRVTHVVSVALLSCIGFATAVSAAEAAGVLRSTPSAYVPDDDKPPRIHAKSGMK